MGFLSSGSPRTFARFLTAFQHGLTETGFAEGRNVTLVYRWAEGHFDELDTLAAELVAKPVDLIAATGGLASALAAKKATNTIPIVAVLGFDPVQAGLAASFNKPGGNFTGTTIITTEMAPKRLSLLYYLDPSMQKVAVLVNPAATSADAEAANVINAATSTGRSSVVLRAGSENELETAFAAAERDGVRGLVLTADPLFMARRSKLAALAMSYKLPVVYPFREFVDAGGLMSYGPSLPAAYHVAGVYAGRILKGTKPSDLPIEAPTTFEFVLNLKTARATGLGIPAELLALVDETVE